MKIFSELFIVTNDSPEGSFFQDQGKVVKFLWVLTGTSFKSILKIQWII